VHELGIASAVLDAVKLETARHPASVPTRVGVRIGELAGINEDALRFSFEAIVRGTDLEALQLDVEICPRRHRCLNCGASFVVRDYDLQCPRCLALAAECIGGTELELAFVELKEYEPSTAGTQDSQ
jgi:hydrogenase nickel incorporation protein HypA/HybF